MVKTLIMSVMHKKYNIPVKTEHIKESADTMKNLISFINKVKPR